MMSPFSAAATRRLVMQASLDVCRAVFFLMLFTVSILLVLSLPLGVPYVQLLKAFVSPLRNSFPLLISDAAPLWLSAMAFAIPLKAGFMNLGGEGQITLGAFSATAVAFLLPVGLLTGRIGAVFSLALCAVAAGLAGGLLAFLAFALRRLFDANEVIVTLLLNLVMASLIVWATKRPLWADASAPGVQTRSLPDALVLSTIWGRKTGAVITAFVAFNLLLLFGTNAFVWWTKGGLQLRAVGLARDAARLCGIAIDTQIARSVIIGGVCGGLAAINQVFGAGRFNGELLVGWGFDGITVAILGRYRLLGILLASLFISLLRAFSIGLQAQGVPYGLFLILQAVFIIGFLYKDRKHEQ